MRLYPKEALDQLPDHDAAEITRQPLEDTLLNLRAMLPKRRDSAICAGRGARPPAPPEVERALQSLMQMEMLAPTHDLHTAPLTPTGSLAAALPVGPQLARLLAYAAVLGVLPEASVLAAALSLRSLFRHAPGVPRHGDVHDASTPRSPVASPSTRGCIRNRSPRSPSTASGLSLAEGKRGGVGADGAAPAAAGDDSGDGEADGGGGAAAAVAAEEEDGDGAVAADDDDALRRRRPRPGDDGGGGGDGGGGDGLVGAFSSLKLSANARAGAPITAWASSVLASFARSSRTSTVCSLVT